MKGVISSDDSMATHVIPSRWCKRADIPANMVSRDAINTVQTDRAVTICVLYNLSELH